MATTINNVCIYTQHTRLLIYNDEVQPGNQLRHDATRKVQIIYWAIKPGPGLGIDQLWFTLGIARSNIVSQIKGGTSAYIKKAMSLFVDHQNKVAPWIRGGLDPIGGAFILCF